MSIYFVHSPVFGAAITFFRTDIRILAVPVSWWHPVMWLHVMPTDNMVSLKTYGKLFNVPAVTTECRMKVNIIILYLIYSFDFSTL